LWKKLKDPNFPPKKGPKKLTLNSLNKETPRGLKEVPPNKETLGKTLP